MFSFLGAVSMVTFCVAIVSRRTFVHKTFDDSHPSQNDINKTKRKKTVIFGMKTVEKLKLVSNKCNYRWHILIINGWRKENYPFLSHFIRVDRTTKKETCLQMRNLIVLFKKKKIKWWNVIIRCRNSLLFHSRSDVVICFMFEIIVKL